MKLEKYAPVVMFVYNRPMHTKRVLRNLSMNGLARKCDLYIFSDAPRDNRAIEAVIEVRKIIHSKELYKEFHSVSVIEAKRNKGLANSIIDGVSGVINKFGDVIVLEDDSVPAVDFLEFMNNCLDYYKNNPIIWSIGGYSFIEELPENYPYDVYTMGRTCSYAWATWKDRWDKVDWSVSDYNKFRYSLKERRAFNHYGNDRAAMLDAQQIGRTSSWAIRFCYAMHKHGMLTVYPRYSRIMNIGQDGSGTNFTRVSKKSSAPTFITEDYIGQPRPMKLVNVPEDEAIYRLFVRRFNMSAVNLMKKHIKNLRFLLKKWNGRQKWKK